MRIPRKNHGPGDPHNLKAIPTKIKENGLITSEMVNLAQKQAVDAGYSDVEVTGEITGQSDFLSKQVARVLFLYFFNSHK